MTYGFTGHRPLRLGGYGKEARQKLYNFAHHTLRQNLKLCDPSVGYIGDEAIVGMAQGWDMAVAQACSALAIPYTTAVPFPGQESVWPDPETRKLYHTLLATAERVVYVSQGEIPTSPGRVAMLLQIRNEYIVDHSNKLISLWDGTRGGTYNCVKYAGLKKVEVINVWPEWEIFK